MAAVPVATLLIFTSQLSAMIRSRLPLMEVLENLTRETTQGDLRPILEEVCNQVRQGVDLGDALERHGQVFDAVYVSIVRSGLASGKLGDSLVQLAVYLRRVEEARRRVIGALSYPGFVLFAFFAVFNGMVFFILPSFKSLFRQFKKELPWPTQLLMDVGAVWQQEWQWVAAIAVGLIAAAAALFVTPEGRRLWDEYKLKVPLAGNLWRLAALSRLTRTLAVQAANEVPILDALRFAGAASGNRYVEELVREIATEIELGSSIADAFRTRDLFTGIVLQMVASGEESGDLEELLVSAADYFDSLLDERLATFTRMINPVLTAIIGILAAAMVIAAFLPVFDVNSLMQGGG